MNDRNAFAYEPLPVPTRLRPLVSCILPTRNRGRFVAQAVQYFLRQSYPSTELVVVDDGRDLVGAILPTDPRIRYIPLPERASLGAKRNLACEAARGALIAHWDDDDWHGHDRLDRQVEALLRSGRDLCGARELLHYDVRAGRAWLYRPADGDRGVAGGTLVYRRSVWRGHPFPDLTVGEDGAFLARLPADAVLALPRLESYIAVLHGENTAARNLADRRWVRRPLSEATGRLGTDRTFYAALRRALDPAASAPPQGADSLPSAAAGSDPADAPVFAAVRGAAPPRVSCLMPTRDRPAFVRRSIAYFLRQTYTPRELIIVDDGARPVADLVPRDPRIRYVRLPARRSIGGKRNLAADLARGDVLVCWDDDDWYGPDRLCQQLAPIRAGRAEASAYHGPLMMMVPTLEFWVSSAGLNRRMFRAGLAAGTLAFRRDAWARAGGFPDRSLAEDADLLDRLMAAGERVHPLTDRSGFVYVRHPRNTWSFEVGAFLDPSGWTRVARPVFMPRHDLAFYRRQADPARRSPTLAVSAARAALDAVPDPVPQ